MRKIFSIAAGFMILVGGGLPQAEAAVYKAGAYYETSATLLCGNDFSCRLHYPQAPIGKWLLVRKVHCWIQRGVPIRTVFLGLTDGPTDSTAPRSIPLFPALQSTTTVNTYVVAADVEFLIGGGKYPMMFADTETQAAGWFMCTLIGTLLDTQP